MQDGGAPAPHVGVLDADFESGGPNFLAPERILAAIRRFKWLVVIAALVGGGLGYQLYQQVQPIYEVDGALWIGAGSENVGGPIGQQELLPSSAWVDLLRSFRVLDAVVVEEKLYIQTDSTYRHLFEDFELSNRFSPGQFTLEVGPDGRTWTLEESRVGTVGSGTVGEPVGADIGFVWTPPASALSADMEVPFSIVNPRDAAIELSRELQSRMDRQNQFIRLSLRGEDPERLTRILGAVMQKVVDEAADLKSAKVAEQTGVLQEQLLNMEQELNSAEQALESFKVNTVTLPREESPPVAAGLQETRGTVFSDFFSRSVLREELQHDQERIRQILDSIPDHGFRVEAFEVIPSVQNSTQLQQALSELVGLRAERRQMLEEFTEEYGPVRDLTQQIQTLEQETIPALARSLLAQLQARERELSGVLDNRAAEMQQIPRRAIEEARLERAVATTEGIYTNLRNRYETARLAEASSIPDIQILDEPRVPSVPAQDNRWATAGMAFLILLGLGVGGAVVMDFMDPKLRYPADLSEDMGMEILGMIPRVRPGHDGNQEQVVEAFREIRMRTDYAYGSTRPLVMSITSPDMGEGKTFVAANLAIAFSQLGRKTLLIDGDTRRGDLHDLLDCDRKPGLVDVLEGSNAESAVQGTPHKNLHFLGSGSRRAVAPELLSSSRMPELLAAAKKRYDVIIIDSPPMAAGSDAFMLGSYAGSLLMVLRSGSTNKSLAKGKLEGFLRLPVRILGGVLNDASEKVAVGAYRYYSYYLPEYSTSEERDGDETGKRPAAV